MPGTAAPAGRAGGAEHEVLGSTGSVGRGETDSLLVCAGCRRAVSDNGQQLYHAKTQCRNWGAKSRSATEPTFPVLPRPGVPGCTAVIPLITAVGKHTLPSP